MDCFKNNRKVLLLISHLLFAALLNAQSLKDSLFGGKLKIDTGKIVTNPGIKISNESSSNAEVYSSNNYYLQKPWKRFVEHYTFLISTDVIGSRKVKYGVYDILIDARVGMDSIVVAEKITCDPENSFIVDLFSDAMKNAPKLVPEIKDGRQLSTKFKQPIRITKLRD